MSAHAYAPAGAPQRERQPRLFALQGGAAAAETEVEAPPARPVLTPVPTPGTPLRDARAGRTLDAELRLAWTALSAGAPAACLVCGGRMEPLAHAPGGACTSCGTTLE
jgi:hypothetical protein